MGENKIHFSSIILIITVCAFIIFGPFYFIDHRPTEDAKTVDEDEFKGVITFWDYPHLDITKGTRFGWILSKIKKFERENQGVYIQFKSLNDPVEIETAIKTGTQPDIGPVANDFSVVSKGVLEPVDEYLSKEEWNDYKEQALKSVQYDGKTWGFPWMMTTYTMLLNIDLFNEKGVEIPKDGDWTYDEFVESLKQLTYDKDGDGKVDVYGFHSFIGSNDYNIWGILLSDGAKIFDRKTFEYKFNDKKAMSGIKKFTDLKTVHKVTADDFGESSEGKAWESFYKEKRVAVYPSGTWAINVLEKLREKGQGFEFDVANYPVGQKGTSVSICKNTSAYGIFKQEDEKKLKMCVKFLKFLSKDEYQEELVKLGGFPVKKSIGEIYEDHYIMSKIEKSLEHTESIPRHPKWSMIEDVIQSQIRQVLMKNKSVKDAIKDAEMKIRTYNKIEDEMSP